MYSHDASQVVVRKIHQIADIPDRVDMLRRLTSEKCRQLSPHLGNHFLSLIRREPGVNFTQESSTALRASFSGSSVSSLSAGHLFRNASSTNLVCEFVAPSYCGTTKSRTAVRNATIGSL